MEAQVIEPVADAYAWFLPQADSQAIEHLTAYLAPYWGQRLGWILAIVVALLCLTTLVAVVACFVVGRPPRAFGTELESARDLLMSSGADSGRNQDAANLENLTAAARHLVRAASIAKRGIGYFRQRVASAALAQLHSVQTDFELAVGEIADLAIRRSAKAASAPEAELWRMRGQDARQMAELVNTVVLGLAARVNYYQSTIILIVAVVALFVAAAAMLAEVLISPSHPGRQVP
jgi:hypothetical protein